MPGEGETIADSLRIQLTNGEGKVIYDSGANAKLSNKPLSFCPECGKTVQPIVYICTGCERKYIHQMDKQTGKIIVIPV